MLGSTLFFCCQSGIMSYGDFKSCLASVGILVGDADCQAKLNIEFVYETYSFSDVNVN